MPSTTLYKKWDVVLVSFPFTHFTSDKRRPGVIVSPDNFNSGKDVVIGFVTSQLQVVPRIGDYTIRRWKEAGLPKPSMVRMKFATIDKSIIVKQFGRLVTEDQIEIRNNLLSFFGT
ncbi:hypothetical protein BH10ACI2_BH10ACI2_02120 [soil metagenome]